MRKPIIAGNWKMNKTLREALEFVEELKPLVRNIACEVVVCPAFVCLAQVAEAVKGSNIKVGAQNMHYEESGAYTGEVSPTMLKELNVDYVIIGHSERRQYFNETDETVNKKVRAALENGLVPIVCCGETLEEREDEITRDIIDKQIRRGLKGFSEDEIETVVVAYEPIWAIGTGKTATDEQANEAIAFIRTVIASMYGKETADKVRIQYGGSVKPGTIRAQMEKSDIDGALVGGASLKASDFAAIVNYK
ncbi:MAG: Triosephosphate isomerase [Firmicutes bacterium]|nr:Triosephosphate isomerase [Bacillota bacterium]